MSLHNLEKIVLKSLNKKTQQTLIELSESTKMDIASVNHAAAWLMSKGYVTMSEAIEKQIELGEEGKNYLKNGLPERNALKLLEAKEISVEEARKKLGNQANIALTWLMKEGIVKVDKGIIKITDQARQFLKSKMPHEDAIEKISKGESISEQIADVLKKRGSIIVIREKKIHTIRLTPEGKKIADKGLEIVDEISQITPEILKTKEWKNKKLRKYDVEMPVQKMQFGRRHPVSQAVDYARKIWLEMGFKEMEGPLIDSEFWVFDALFVPQDHPAREMQDTLFIDGKQKLNPELVKRVAKAHEIGVNGSDGWGYEFNERTAERLIMRTHTTCLSAHTLAELKKTDWPAKFFAIGRVFRNETIDWKHGFEFNQTEGIVVDPNANFKNLLGYLKQFYAKLGFENIRFKPKYFPYTEMSIVTEVYNEKQGEWYELGGAGIFRPEVVEPLLGEPIPVLAWGLGMDRLFMQYYQFEKFSEVYKNDIKKLRDVKQWMM